MEITWSEGIERIQKFGLIPFFQRIDAVFQNGMREFYSFPSSQYIVAYDTIFTMCIQRDPYNFSAELYKFQENEIKNYCVTKIDKILQDAETAYNGNKSSYLKCWCTAWKMVTFAINGIYTYFQYLDRFFVPNSEGKFSVKTNGYGMFFKHSFTKYAQFTRTIILNWIKIIRKRTDNDNFFHDYLCDNKIIRDSINVFAELNEKLRGRIQNTIFHNSVDIKLLVKGYINDTIHNHIKYYTDYEFPKEFHNLIVQYYGRSDVSIYDKYFYNYLILNTKDYYSIKSKQWIQSKLSITKYFTNCSKILENEADNLQNWGILTKHRSDVIIMIKYEVYNPVQIKKLIKYNKEFIHIKYFIIDILQFVLLFFNQYVHVEIKQIVDDEITNLFNYYILKSREKGKKLETIYEILDIYQYFVSKKYISYPSHPATKGIKVFFRKLVNTQRYYINNLMIRLWSYSICNFDRINSVNTSNVDNIIDLIVIIYNLMDDYGQKDFVTKYINKLKMRITSKKYISSNKYPYYEKQMLNKLQNIPILMHYNNNYTELL